MMTNVKLAFSMAKFSSWTQALFHRHFGSATPSATCINVSNEFFYLLCGNCISHSHILYTLKTNILLASKWAHSSLQKSYKIKWDYFRYLFRRLWNWGFQKPLANNYRIPRTSFYSNGSGNASTWQIRMVTTQTWSLGFLFSGLNLDFGFVRLGLGLGFR